MLEIVNEKEVLYFQKKILKWGKDNFDVFPWRFTQNRWHNLVAEIMLQRTRAEQVVPVFQEFCKRYPKPSDYFNVERSDVFRTLGLPEREKNLKKLASILIEYPIPTDHESLLKLPGIGDYIAAAYRSLHLNLPDTIIDSNVVRVYGRFFGFTTYAETRRKKSFIELANFLTPKKQFRTYNYGVIDFTRTICRPKPECDICPLRKKCRYHANRYSVRILNVLK